MLEFLATTSKFFTLKPLSLRNTQVSLSTYENDFLLLLIIILIIYLPKTKNFDFVGRGDLTSLLFSKFAK